jgi:hypothetical protein
MLWLSFGAHVHAPTRLSPERITGEFALHMQCPWRVSGVGGVVAGSSDMLVPADPDDAAFDSGRPGAALGDAHLLRWLDAHAGAPLLVTGVQIDRCGGFVLQLSEEFAFEVFPDASTAPDDEREQWRLFEPARGTPHFVVSNRGVDDAPAG